MIYYVEDDLNIRELVLYALKNTGFEARGFENGADFFSALSGSADSLPEIILLDIMLPDEDGISILHKIKSRYPDMPVIMITAKGTEYDKVTGLDGGADDYISKPFGMMELVSRIKAVLRRAGRTVRTAENEIFHSGTVELDLKSHTVTVGGTPIELTLKEFELLHLLMKNAGVVLTRDTLLETVWGYEAVETRTVDVHIKTLRQKLCEGAEIIKTVRGVGYKVN